MFTVPNEALAIAVATEWDAQKDTLKAYTMHLVQPFTWLLWRRAKFGSQPVFRCFVMSQSKDKNFNICFELHIKLHVDAFSPVALIYCLRKYSYILDLSLKVFLIFNEDSLRN